MNPVLVNVLHIYNAAMFLFLREQKYVTHFNEIKELAFKERGFMDQFTLTRKVLALSKDIQDKIEAMENEPHFPEVVLKFYKEIEKPLNEILNVYRPASIQVARDPSVFSAFF